MKMKILICVLALACTTYAIPSGDDFSEQFDPELALFDNDAGDVLLEAKATVSTLMAKGVKESDCKDLAKTMCTEVESEVSKQQKILDLLATGSRCAGLGQKAIVVATREHKKRVTEWETSKKEVVKAAGTKVTIGSHTFSSLREGNCGFVFTSGSYLTVKRQYQAAITREIKARGKKTESTRSLKLTIEAAKREKKKCLCMTKKTRDSTWSILSKTTTRTRQVKAHAKCKMMSCVLNGTSLDSAQCKSSLKRLNKRRLVREAEAVTGC